MSLDSRQSQPSPSRDPISGTAPANDTLRAELQSTGEQTRQLGERGSIAPNDNLWSDVQIAIRKRRFIRTYFTQLDTEYDALCSADYRAQHCTEVERLRARHAQCPSWELNHRFEYILLAGLAPAILRQRLCIYRERLAALAGVPVAALASTFPEPNEDDVNAQREIGFGMLAEIQRLRHVRSEFERLRNRLLVSFLCVGGIFALLFFYLWSGEGRILPPPVHVVAAGLLGAYFSVLLRLGALRWSGEYNANYQQVDKLFWNMISSFALAMFEGAVAAFVLHTIFMAGAIEGAVFPKFLAVDIRDGDLTQLLHIAPVTTAESAKLILWCILAGFSERLIPDILSSLAQDAERRTPDAKTATKGATPIRG